MIYSSKDTRVNNSEQFSVEYFCELITRKNVTSKKHPSY